MKIQVTLTFDSPEAAIVALGKYTTIPQEIKAATPDAPAAEKPPGKKRGPKPKNKGSAWPLATGAGETAVPATNNPPSTEPAKPSRAEILATPPPPPEVAGPPGYPSPAEVTAALQACLDSVGMQKTRSCFARYGVTRGAEVPPEKRAEFIAYLGKVARKEVDPDTIE